MDLGETAARLTMIEAVCETDRPKRRRVTGMVVKALG